MTIKQPASKHRLAAAAGVVAIVACAAFHPRAAAADILPISLELGPQVPVHGSLRTIASSVQPSADVNFDFGPQTIIPIRASLQVDDSNGAAGGGNFNEFGFGVAGRLTTPIYAGAGISVYNVNARLSGLNAPNVSETSVGENFFIGERLLSLPGGVNFSLQATYKNIPQFDGVNPSAVGVGLRVQL